MTREVIIFGDLFEQNIVIPRTKNVDPDDPNVKHEMERFGPRYKSFNEKTGGPFLKAAINWSLGEKRARFHDITIENAKIVEIIDVYEYFSKTDNSDERVLRREKRYINETLRTRPPPSEAPQQVSGAVAVFYDCDMGFRRSSKTDANDAAKIEERKAEAKKREVEAEAFERKRNAAVAAAIKDPSAVIVAIRDNIDLPCVEGYKRLIDALGESNRTIFLLRLDLLKSAGVRISNDTTLEKLVEDVSRYFRDSRDKPANDCERLCRQLRDVADNIVIVVDNLALNIDKNTDKSSLQFLPNFRPPSTGEMPHEIGVYASAIATLMADEGLDREKFHGALNETIRLALLAFNYSFELGIEFGRDVVAASPFDGLERVLHPGRLAKENDRLSAVSNDLYKVIQNKDGKFDRYLFSSIAFPLDRPWKRTDVYSKADCRGSPPGTADIHEICRKIVRFGVKAAGRSNVANSYKTLWPTSCIACPYAEYGKLKLINSSEIEEYASCSRIISKYLGDINSEKPLSIGLFGSPGTGKSFAVTQLVNSNRVGPGPEPKIFNLAQFNSIDQLTECFHSIQSAVLASKGQPPLVMFDEFDSDFEGEFLGWLKYFLAPMQDGAFQGKTGIYHIGRAIFAFAGGRSEKFDLFRGQIDREQEKAKTAKLPDFVSRLRGYANIKNLGLFPPDQNEDSPGEVILLRRAILLRSLLEEQIKDVFINADRDSGKQANIDDDVIDEFVQMKEYKYVNPLYGGPRQGAGAG